MTPVDISNIALGRIGQGASSPIQSIEPDTDDSEAARACARAFPLAMRAMLREHQWSWAQRSVALALSSESVPGYSYAYAYPAACQHLHGLTPEGADPYRVPVSDWPSFFRWPHRIVAAADLQSRVIATDLSPAVAHYTADILTPAFADSLFHEALAWRMAKELALLLRANPQFATAAGQEYEVALSKAIAANDNEGMVAMPHVPEDIRAYGHPGYLDGWNDGTGWAR